MKSESAKYISNELVNAAVWGNSYDVVDSSSAVGFKTSSFHHAVLRSDQRIAEDFLVNLTKEFGQRHGVTLEIKGEFSSPPKPITDNYSALLEAVRDCGQKLGINSSWEASGGVSDGNKLAAAGLPNVDTLGAVGGNIHSPQEFLVLDSLLERSRLTALLLMRFGSGDLVWPPKVGKGS